MQVTMSTRTTKRTTIFVLHIVIPIASECLVRDLVTLHYELVFSPLYVSLQVFVATT
jgi:hypothetical protein